MNWGNKLVLVFVVFAALMATLVYNATQTKFELVSKDYYQDELRYQDIIDGASNASLNAPISILIENEYVIFQFPELKNNANITGEAWFYCAVDATKDKRIPLNVNELGVQRIARKLFQKENYEVKISYEAGGKKYYAAHQLMIP